MDKEQYDKALKIPLNKRVVLAELILASLEHEEKEVRDAWIAEVKKRMKAVDEGKAGLLDFDALYNEGYNN